MKNNIGELFKKLSKATNQYKSACDTDVTSKKDKGKFNKFDVTTKEEITTQMGFDRKIVSRFETLAKNKDLVEQVKQEARENNINPTRTQVKN